MNLVPTASTTAALAMGDALAMCLMEKRGFKAEDYARLHPGGRIGKKLMKVSELMHTGSNIPKVFPDTPMKEVIYEMSRKKLGITTVVDRNRKVLGVISDGDLRRHLEKDNDLLKRTAQDCMSKNPKTISPDELAATALHVMEENKITSLPVIDSQGQIQGIIHLHDLWRTELI